MLNKGERKAQQWMIEVRAMAMMERREPTRI
jgi:hypothetical protein